MTVADVVSEDPSSPAHAVGGGELPNAALYEQLRRPLAWYRPRRYWYRFLRLVLERLGPLSDGIRLGLETGFDSGESLEYAYRNRAAGRTLVGEVLDRIYLSRNGWRVVRARRQRLIDTLGEEIARRRRGGGRVHVVDLAAGAGSYIVETLDRIDDSSVTAVCRDRDEGALVAGRRLAAATVAAPSVRFEVGDAFDPTSIRSLSPPPDIVVVSGLYELFSDNLLIARSLVAVRRVIRDGGCLVYTNQPWHPQLELIARVLVRQNGERWVMRPRPQTEMDELVRGAGFRPRSTTSGAAGVFTVTVAEA